MELGMAMILQVGNYAEMAQAPSNFPTCGNWYQQEELQNSTSAYINRPFVLVFTGICISVVSTVIVLRT